MAITQNAESAVQNMNPDFTLVPDVRPIKGGTTEMLRVNGYMAEHRRQWNNGNRINWHPDNFVDWR